MNILIVEARYHPDVADALMDGATAALEKGLARFERISVPGERSHETRLARAKNGIPIAPALAKNLDQVADELGMAKLG